MRVHILLVTSIVLFFLMVKDVTSQCANPIDFEGDSSLGPRACSGYLLDMAGNRICGNFDNDAARRACWELEAGITGGGTRRRRCRVADHDLSLVDNVVIGQVRQRIQEGTIGEACNAGSPDCFLDCHRGGGPIPAAAIDHIRRCQRNPKDAAIACDDINECLEGVFRNCRGPFDKDCSIGPACSENAICTNDDPGFSCTCAPGYMGTNPNQVGGCTDMDECTAGNPCVDPNMCQNIPGSYICLCQDGFSWDPVETACERDSCGPSPTIFESTTLGGSMGYGDTRTYQCDDGYEPSVTGVNEFTTSCRADGTWCNCNSLSCQRIKCCFPPMDANANTPMTAGLYLDVLVYACHRGFRANGAETYQITCMADGTWSDPGSLCGDRDECQTAGICPENSKCHNTYGSHLCLCNPGYTSSGSSCEEISCGPIPEVQQATMTSVIAVADGRFGMVVSYRCDDGYRASIEKNHHTVTRTFDIECKLDECWSPQPIPQCIPVSCSDPGTLPHASRDGTSFYYNDVVTYECYEGFRPSDSAIATQRTFTITCGADGEWSQGPYCVDINECQEIDQPCGPGDGHYCINKVGTYTCSCAPRYRLDATGKTCIEYPPQVQYINQACDFYTALNFCNNGECYYDNEGIPRCSCNGGYTGLFCDEPDKYKLTLPFILAIAGIALAVVTLIICIVIACYVCSRHHHYPYVPGGYSPAYRPAPIAPVVTPGFPKRRPRFLAIRKVVGS